jgi:hypothetical protein
LLVSVSETVIARCWIGARLGFDRDGEVGADARRAPSR